MFVYADARAPFDRDARVGFRCAKYLDTKAPPEVFAPVVFERRDYAREAPASDEVFRSYAGFYRYERKPLGAKLESADDSEPRWRKEKVSFDAAYGGERVIAYVYTPRGRGSMPYQPVIYFPGCDALSTRSSDDLTYNWSRISYLVGSGRAVIFPVYRGTYE